MNKKARLFPFVVSLNSSKVLEYYRDRPLSKKQHRDLEATDTKLNAGILAGGRLIQNPSMEDKSVFIANQLADALDNDDEVAIAIACAYLATRFINLKQLKITTHEDRVSIELVNDKEFAEQIPMKFTDKKNLL